MKNLTKYFTMLMMVMAMSFTFTACGSDDNDDGPDYGTVSITNGSGYDLPSFTVHFLNASKEELTSRDYGTLYDGDNIKATIPTAATQFYMATKLSGTWYFSAYYPISYTTMKLTRAEVGNWSSN